MTKWTRTRRDPGRESTDEQKLRCKRQMLTRSYDFVEGGLEAEPDFVKAVKEVEPGISKEKLKELTMLFRAAVYERQRASAISLNLFSDSRSSEGLIFSAPESMTSRMESRSVSIADLRFVAAAAPDPLLRFPFGITYIFYRAPPSPRR
jgi:hypothetical protein